MQGKDKPNRDYSRDQIRVEIHDIPMTTYLLRSHLQRRRSPFFQARLVTGFGQPIRLVLFHHHVKHPFLVVWSVSAFSIILSRIKNSQETPFSFSGFRIPS